MKHSLLPNPPEGLYFSLHPDASSLQYPGQDESRLIEAPEVSMLPPAGYENKPDPAPLLYVPRAG
ncbi:hypothetical protein D3C75_1291530 [compost metagenome]